MLAGATAVIAQTGDDGMRLRALLDESAAADDRLDPMSATRKGKPGDGPLFVDPLSDFYADALRAQKTRELAALSAINRAALIPIDRIAYDVFAYRTRQTMAYIESGAFQTARLAPLNPSFGLQVEFPDFVSGAGASFASLQDYEDGLIRLNGFAGYLGNTVSKLKQGVAAGYVQPRIIVENILKQVDALLLVPVDDSPFFKAIGRMPADIPAADKARLIGAYRTTISEKIYPGYRQWQIYLRDIYLPLATAAPGRWAMKGGNVLYAAELARHTTTTRSAADIHTLGLSEVARIRNEMEAVRTQIGYKGNLKAFFAHIRTDPRYYYTTSEELLARFKAVEAKIWPSIPKLFHDRPKAPFEVRPLPALGDQRGTGYYRPGEPDGVSPGILFFNMSMLGTRPIPTLETLTLHEGIPGHHFQITLARENESLPPLLRFGSSTAYTEGWGLYAESLGRELGMFGDPLQWFGHLDMEMLRAVRLVVDTGLHAKQWDRQKAIDYIRANTSMADKDVAVEIDRYIAYPGQACAYKIGELKFRELRIRAEKALKDQFDVRDYHREALNTGAIPMDVLEAKIENWIVSTRTEKQEGQGKA
ncbi:DUF885 domain-containing protein [Sphingobium boeckii]|uniref:Uncharacterized protein (DUF885 family) n=1 Tax=Sphingobium boeckii TaxID=1082345 RepID=A0A7W9AK00_9SPHN|nr:DUF885 domain-containing protein [Sphingobium boeckii]MBB5686876.1 uncharacterized protein (DUF885 family) [Sphingobium boeckii]